MTDLMKREPRSTDVFDRFDRLFDDWARMMPFRRPNVLGRALLAEDVIRVEEHHEKDAIVIRAELPGIDPDRDVELSVTDGMLHIAAERRDESEKTHDGFTRRELRYGSFSRSLPLPPGVHEESVVATYKDGMLEIRIPVPEQKPGQKIPISKA